MAICSGSLHLGCPPSDTNTCAKHRCVQQHRRILLHVNLLLEFAAIQLHIFVRVARVAVFARKLAPAIRIDRPLKRHAIGIAAIQNRSHRQQKILRPFLRFPRAFRRGREAARRAMPTSGASASRPGTAIREERFTAACHRPRLSRSHSRGDAGTWRGATRRSSVNFI